MEKDIDKSGRYNYQAFHCISKESPDIKIPVDFTLFIQDNGTLDYLEIIVDSDRKVLINPEKELTHADKFIGYNTLHYLEDKIEPNELYEMIEALNPKSKEIVQKWQRSYERKLALNL